MTPRDARLERARQARAASATSRRRAAAADPRMPGDDRWNRKKNRDWRSVNSASAGVNSSTSCSCCRCVDGRRMLSRRGEVPAIRRTTDLHETLRAQQTAQIVCPSAGQWRLAGRGCIEGNACEAA